MKASARSPRAERIWTGRRDCRTPGSPAERSRWPFWSNTMKALNWKIWLIRPRSSWGSCPRSRMLRAIDSCWSLHSPLISAVALKISSTGTLNHFTMLRFTSPKANKKRQVAGISVSRISETSNFVLNFEPGFCCFRSAQTLIKVRRSTNPKMSRTRKMNVESVYKRTIWLGSEGLRKGSKLNAACTNTNRANVSRKNPAIYSFVVCGGAFMTHQRKHKDTKAQRNAASNDS